MFEKLRKFSGTNRSTTSQHEENLRLSPEETSRIGTEEDPLHGHEAAIERHEAAMRADPDTAIRLYTRSVESFVGVHPYEALATLHERRRDYPAALHATEAYIKLAKSGQ